MDTALEILRLFINPWTFLLFLFVCIFQKSVRSVLVSLGHFVDNLHDVTYKGLRLSEGEKGEISKKLLEAVRDSKEPVTNIDHNAREKLAERVEKELTKEDLSLFAEAFRQADSVVVRRGSKHEGSFYRLRDSGAVELGMFSLGTPRKVPLQEWRITDLGKELCSVLAKFA